MSAQKAKICSICTTPFKGRRDAKTCSPACRKRLQRNLRALAIRKAKRLESALGRDLHRVSAILLQDYVIHEPLVLADQRGSISAATGAPLGVVQPPVAPPRPVDPVVRPQPPVVAEAQPTAASPPIHLENVMSTESLEPSPEAEQTLFDDNNLPPTELKGRRRISLFGYNKMALMVTSLVLLVITGLGFGGFSLLSKHNSKSGQANNSPSSPSSYSVGSLPLGNVASNSQLQLGQASTLSINGQLRVSNTLVLTPGGVPSNPEAGQFYYDKTTNVPYFYNGTQFISLASQGVSSIGGANGNIGLDSSLSITNNRLGVSSSILQQIAGIGASGSGVTSLQGQTGKVVLGSGSGISINGTTISNSGVLSLTGTADQVNVSGGTGNVVLSLPQSIAVTSTPTFGGLTVNGTISAATLQQTAPGNNLNISAGNDNISFTAGGRTFIFPTSGPASQIICTTGISCASGGGQAVLLQPGSVQNDTGSGSSVFINNTAGGNLLELQGSGVDHFVVTNAGNVTGGTYNGQTISSAANFTGTVAIQGANALTLGAAGSNTGAIIFRGAGGAGTLTLQGPTTPNVGNFALSIPTITGNDTVCTVNLGNCAGSGGGITGSGTSGTIPLFSGTNSIGNSILTQSGGTVTVAGDLSATNLSGNGSGITALNGSNISSGTVANARLVNSGALTVTAGTGLSGGGSVALGASTTLNVTYGSAANTAVQGNTTLTCASGTGNLSGGGNSITLGSGGSCGNIAITNSPTFSGTLAVQGAGGITVGVAGSVNGVVNLANSTNANLNTLQSAAVGQNQTITIPDALAGTDQVCLVNLGNCAGSGGGITGTGTAGTIALFSGTHAIGNSILTQSGGTVSVAGDLSATNLLGNGSGITALNGSNVSSGTVANARLVNSGALTVTAGNGLSGGGSVALGGSTNLAVVYGSGANTAVQGNTTLTCASGTGNLSGGGNTVTLGTGGTCSNISITNSPMFSGTVTVQGAGGIAVGVAGSVNGVISLANSTNANLNTLQSAAVGQNQTITIPDALAGSDQVCLVNLGNCAGSGGGVTGAGTAGTIALFSGTHAIGNSTLTQSGSTLTASGNVVIQGANSLALGTASANTGAIQFKNSSNANTVTLQSGASGSNFTLTLPTTAGGNGDCLQSNGSGVLSFASCTGGAGGGVTSLDGLIGVLTLNNSSGSAGAITIDNAAANGTTKGIATFNSTNFTASSGVVNTIQNIATTSTPTFGGLTLTGQLNANGGIVTNNANINAGSGTIQGGTLNATTALQLGGVNINAGGTLSNVAYLDQNQTFTGTNAINNTSTAAFQVQNSGGSGNLLIANTTDGRVGIGNAPTGAGARLTVTGTNTLATSLALTAGGSSGTGLVVSNAGTVAIGIAPVANTALYINKNIGSNTNSYGQFTNLTATATGTIAAGTYSTLALTASGAGGIAAGQYITNNASLTGGSSSSAVGTYSDTTATGAVDGTSTVAGSIAFATLQGANSAASITGGNFQASNNSTSGTATSGATGVLGAVNIQNSNNTTQARAFEAGIGIFGTGNVSDFRAINVESAAGGGAGTIGTAYGLYVNGLKNSYVSGTAYGIYQAGASDLNYLGGATTIASTLAIQGANALTLGTTGTNTGAIVFKGSTAASGTITLQGPANPSTNNYTLSIPTLTANDTICTTISNPCSASGAAGGDLSGFYPNPSVAKLQGTNLTLSSLASGDVLQYNGSAIVNGHVTNSNLTAGSFGNITGVGTLTGGLNIASGQTYKINGTDINTAGTLSNVAYLNQNQTFTGTNAINKTSTTAFQIQNGSGAGNLLVADTQNTRLGVGTASPNTTLNVYNGSESLTQTDFTQALDKGGINITTDFTDGAYTPGIFWSTQDNNPTKPKAGIYMQEDGTFGTSLLFGTSNLYTTGITNTALTIGPKGNSIFKNSNDSSAGFQIQDSTSTALLTVNTTLGVGSVGVSKLTIDTLGSAGATALCLNGSFQVSTCSSAPGVNTVGTLDSQTKSANGAVISGSSIYLQSADASFPGLVTAGTQTLAGAKTFSGLLTGSAGLTASGGAISLTGNAASSLTTSSGALTVTSAAAATWGTSSGTLTVQSGSGTLSLGSTSSLTNSGALTIQGGSTLTLESTGTNVVSLDSGSTGAINVGTGANAKTLTVGNATGATSVVVNAGTAGITLNPVGGSSNNGVLVKPTNDTTAAFQVQNAAGNTYIQADTSGANLYLGNTGIAGTIQVGNTANAVAQTINIGNNGTVGSSNTINIGAAGSVNNLISIGNSNGSISLFASSVSIGSALSSSPISISNGTGAINIGANSAAHMVTVGSTTTTASTIIQAGTGGLSITTQGTGALAIGNNAVAQTINIGNTTGATATNIQAGSGGINLTGNVKLATNGAILDLASTTNGNTAIMKIPQLATSGTCASGSAQGLILQNTGGTQVGHICISGPSAGTPNQLNFYGNFNTGTTDVAENYSDVDNNLEPGDVVALDTTSGVTKGIVKADASHQNVLGVISTSPGLLLSGISDSDGSTDLVNPKPVALSGRIPTKVSAENGPIAVGDYLMMSSTPGVAMKATVPGMTIGRALASYNGSGIGSVEVFAQTQYYAGPSGTSYLQNGQDVSFNNLSATGSTTLANLHVSGSATLASLTVTGSATIGTLVVTGDTYIGGDLTIDGHVITASGQPTAQGQGAIGTGASVSVDGTDTTGIITITTGTNPTTGDLAKIIFSKTYGKSPHIVLSASNDKAAGLRFYKGTTNTTNFMFDTIDTPQANTTYTFDYFIAQ